MRTAIVGVGFMGWIHYLAYQRSPHAELVGFCSRSEAKRSGDWTSIQGNFGPPGRQIDVSGLTVTEHWQALLEDPGVDVIDVCLPPSMHEEVVVAALDAGKHVLCEKPLALQADTARRLADRGDGRLMVAHILPFHPEFQLLVDAAGDQRWGKPIAGRFKRTIGPPDWIPDFYDATSVGGPLLDLHVHDAHLIRLLFGMPDRVDTASRKHQGVPKLYETVFHFNDSPVVVSCGGGVIDSSARPFTHGFEVSFEKATVRFEFAAYADGQTSVVPLTIMHADGTVEMPTLGDGDPITAFAAEINAAAESVRTGKIHPVLDASIAADAIEICQMQAG
ncbi:1,5-anhydro-D-fructose reductase [Crateriforma conspicua]|uniref:1,5-anhydro-D-fructose reductase n=1 Tax=Crateriforma conspicua TaxID=2527996 RepID=A0A5C6FKM6_9PLAN|nr:Gfo/Idh/MocA family oxidoreductase [Crateriforma conspicua]TWU62680.1 1,5-anhydro-D-fructose reductase [Crateriforma conspicua]